MSRTSPNPETYRADLDGLRAIAVTSVVAFHAGLPFVDGGFVGVDVFFVISGYLITQLLLREAVKRGTIDLAEFYARRIRRLFPALAVVVIATILLSTFFLLPVGEQPKLARSTYMTAVYVSNIYFRTETADYFAGPSDQQPLLHTWSLSVEEQYYLVWPALVMCVISIVRRLPKLSFRRTLAIILCAIIITSLFFSIRWTHSSAATAFYYLPSRAWELGVGGLLALLLEKRERGTSAFADVLVLIGVGSIVAAIVHIDETVPFPGVSAILPALGTSACVVAGALGSKVGMVVLGNPALVSIGRLSYSWYLWHWPLLALVRAHSLGERDVVRDVAVVAISLLLAVFTLHFVENPIRFRKLGPFARRWPTIGAGLGISLGLCAAAWGLQTYAARTAQEPQYAELLAIRADKSPLNESCHRRTLPLTPRAECTVPGASKEHEILVWGDSHAERMLAPVLDFARQHDIPVVQRTSAACPPLLGVIPTNADRSRNKRCSEFNRAVLDELSAEVRTGKRVVVVLAGRWANYLNTVSPAGVRTRTLVDDAGTAPSELMYKGLDRSLDELERLGVQGIVVGSPPEFSLPPPECRFRRSDDSCSMPRWIAELYRRHSHRIVEVAAREHAGFQLVDVFQEFCDELTCSPIRNSKLAYADSHHLAFTAAAELSVLFAPSLRRAAFQPFVP